LRSPEQLDQLCASGELIWVGAGLDRTTPYRGIAVFPDVASARKRLAVAERTIHDAELQLSPTLNLVSQANYATAVTLGPHATWNVQGVLNVPLYDGGARYGEMVTLDAFKKDPHGREGELAAKRHRRDPLNRGGYLFRSGA